MYCTGADHDDCQQPNTRTRNGAWSPFIPNTEDLLKDYKVDIAIWAHEHNYERFWPMYNYTVMNGTTHHNQPYTNARAPLHMITGSAGCQEQKEEFKKKKPYYSAFRNNDYGYTRLKAHNKTHLEFSQVSDDKDGAIIDNFFVIKHSDFQAKEQSQPKIKQPPQHYNMQPYYQIMRKINEKKKRTNIDIDSFPIIDIIF